MNRHPADPRQRSSSTNLLSKACRVMVVGFIVGMITNSVFGQSPSTTTAGVAATTQSAEQMQLTLLTAQMNGAIARVQQIVNQPVRRYPLTGSMKYWNYPEGWFHQGAIKPDFNTVDVRKTQETPYATKDFVTSPLLPGIAFRGADLEFNAYTKYFIVDRTVPKKKLTEAEMLEINNLYRTIGKCEAAISSITHPAGTGEQAGDALPAVTTPRGIDPDTGHWMVGGLAVVLCALVLRRMLK